MKLLLTMVSGEFIKLFKHTIFRYLLIAIPLISLLNGTLYIGIDNMKAFSRIAQEENIWVGYYLAQFLIMSPILLIISNICISLIFLIEDKNNTWKYLFTLPVPIYYHFLSKIITATLTACLIYILFSAALIINALLLPFFYNDTFLEFGYSLKPLVILTIKLVIVSFSISIIHTLLVFIVKQQTIILLLSVFLPIVCIYSLLKYLPYGWPIQNFWLTIKNKYEFKDWYPLISTYEVSSISLAFFCFAILFSQRDRLSNPKILMR